MWDGFKDHPMRRDYVDPDDFEYEPTAHDDVLRRAQEHDAAAAGQQSQQETGAGA
jgi:NADH-quinone oxidoreductase subunit C